MKLRRNLQYPEGVPVTELGPAAIDDLLERGDMESWAPLARAVRHDPHGPLADTILRIVRAHEMYGSSALWITWIEGLRGKSHGLASIRRSRRLTQQEVAGKLGISQSDVSKLERRPDIRVSTLKAYVRATGGKLKLVAAYPDGEKEINSF